MFKRVAALILPTIILSLLLMACGNKAVPPTFQTSSSKEDVDIRSTYYPPETPADIKGLSITDVINKNVLQGGDSVIFYIYNPGGIGDATIELTGGEMPKTIQARLFVNGLENLELTYGDVLIMASASANGPVVEKLRLGGGEADLAPGNPYWIDIQVLPAQEGGLFVGDPMLPASYLITLPDDFHSSQSTRFSLKWVDFYR